MSEFSSEKDTMASDMAGAGEEEEVEQPIYFEEPLDFSAYDEFHLSEVVKRKLTAIAENPTRVTSPKENNVIGSIDNLTNLIRFEEDAEDILLAEEMKASIAAQKLQEAMEASAIEDNNACTDETAADDKGTVKERSASKGVAAEKPRGLQSWADSIQLPPEEFEKIRPNMALEYPFELDNFQKQAVVRLERHEHVFVAAHTSAGKTVVAEYAIALALKHNSRAVYTSPIKALSNQKYRDFKERFGADNVGIITGDVSVNPQAQCLIMTTEIFRSMLYKGADTVRDIEYVIFDEVHYVNDAERGVVWEEVIIMLPETICLIFLSATTPNAVDFSDWIGRTKHKKVYLTSTNKRPVPLQHFMFYEDEVFKLLDHTGFNSGALPAANKLLREKSQPKPMTSENAKFAAQRQQEKANIAAQRAGKDPKKAQQIKQQYMAAKPMAKNTGNVAGKGGAVGGGKMDWLSLLNILQAGGREARGGQGQVDFGVPTNNRTVLLSKVARQEKNEMIPYEKLPSYLKAQMSKKEYEQVEVRGSENEPEVNGSEIGLLPVVIFSFSKKKCEELADYFKGQDMLTNREKGKVLGVVSGVLQRLSPVDAELPQISRLKELLLRGIGVHHSGLLPILKETVEILFSQSLVKVLLATETFAMGVNMPARSVVFNGYRKHDGRQFRDLLPGEYIQMAGRAGRRGLDRVGTVIIAIWTELPAEVNIKKLLTGQPTMLSSQFRLRYNMILNLIRADTLSVEDMMKKSFTEFSAQKALAGHDLQHKLKKYEMLVQYLEELQNQFEEINEPYNSPDFQVSYEIAKYVEYFQSAQSILYTELQAIEKILLNNRQPNSIDHFFTAGRALQVHNVITGKPAYAVVLLNPSKTYELKEASIVKPAAKAESALSAARASLMGGGSSTQGKKNIVTARTATVLALVMLDLSDLPAWCKTAEPIALDSIDLKSLPARAVYSFCLHEGTTKHFIILELPLKDVGIIYDCILDIASIQNSQSLNVSTVLQIITTSLNKKLPAPLDMTRLQKSCVTNDLEIADLQHKLNNMMHMAYQYVLLNFPSLSAQYLNVYKMRRVNEKLDIIRHAISSASISLFPEFRQRRNVLQQLGYIQAVDSSSVYKHSVFDAQAQNDRHVITKKGRVCCELNTCDELLGTEMLFHNVLEPLNPPEIAGLISALVFQEKNEVEEVLTCRMETARQQMMEIFHQLNTLQQCENIEVDPEITGAKPVLNFGLCSVVYQWARGVAFKDIVAITQFQEGSIVRTITRLDELCRDIQNAARVMGNQSLYYKMEAVSQCIKRDIVFAASLYIT